MKALFNKDLYKVILVCFVAPGVFNIIIIAAMLLTYRVVGFGPVAFSLRGVAGCVSVGGQVACRELVFYTLCFLVSIAGFLLARRGYRRLSNNYVIAGAFLFTWALHFVYLFITDHVARSRPWFWFTESKEEWRKVPMALFGNFYNYMWFETVLQHLLVAVYIVLGVIILFRFSNKTLRMQFFTFGILAGIIGATLWILFVMPSFGHYVFAEPPAQPPPIKMNLH